jgi:hypothetical protein
MPEKAAQNSNSSDLVKGEGRVGDKANDVCLHLCLASLVLTVLHTLSYLVFTIYK